MGDQVLLYACGAAVVIVIAGFASAKPAAVMAFAIPFLMEPIPFSVGGVPASFLVTVVLIMAGFAAWLRRRVKLGALPSLALIATLLLFASNYLHPPAGNLDASETRNSMLTLVANIWLLVTAAAVAKDSRALVRGVAFGGFAFSTIALVLGSDVGGRLSLDVLNPNSAGHAAALGILSSVAAWRLLRSRKWLLLSVPSWYLVVAAQSRGGLVVLAVGLAAIWAMTHRGRSRVLGVVLGVAAVIALWGPASQFAHDDLLAARDARFVESDSRVEILRIAVANVLDHPLGGVGYGRFLDYTEAGYGLPLNTHNDWARFAVEAGLPFLFVVVAILILPAMRKGDPALRVIVIAGCVSLGFANAATDLRVTAPLWVCAGVLWAANCRRNLPPADESEMVQGASAGGPGRVRRISASPASKVLRN